MSTDGTSALAQTSQPNQTTANPHDWKVVCSDPNDGQLMKERLAHCKKTHQKAVADRNAYLASLAQDKRVLDVGVADHFAEAMLKKTFLHKQIAESASYCLGVDILEDAVTELKKHGYNVVHADITQDTIGERFDLMVVGEVIEHLGNPDSLFKAARKHLSEGGRLVMTTPSPFTLPRMIQAVIGTLQVNVDHVAWFTASEIHEMAKRNGMELVAHRTVTVNPVGRSFLHRALYSVAKLFVPHDLLAHTVIYECGISK